MSTHFYKHWKVDCVSRSKTSIGAVPILNLFKQNDTWTNFLTLNFSKKEFELDISTSYVRFDFIKASIDDFSIIC